MFDKKKKPGFTTDGIKMLDTYSDASSKKFLIEQVTRTARIALKNLVKKGLLPWPMVYSKEFWNVAVTEDFSSIVGMKQYVNQLSEEALQEFIDEADDILVDVKDTVEEFVQVAKDHVKDVKTSLKSMDKKDEDRLFFNDIERLRQKNRDLEKKARQTEDKVRQQALTIEDLRSKVRVDGLTGLLNRRALEGDLQKELSKIKRYNYPLSLIMCDIDFFKKVNDTYGHSVGDKVLKNLASIWKKSVRDTDSVYRYGGEEFVIIAPHTKKKEGFNLAERLRKRVSTYRFVIRPPDEYITITISVGISEARPGDSIIEVINRVDKALYMAKEAGRNRTMVL